MASPGITEPALEQLIRQYESALRAGVFQDRPLPEHWEKELASIDRSTAMGKLRYWGTLKAYLLHTQEKRREEEKAKNAQQVALQLLRREPVWVTLSSGRRVPITGRSLLALIEMAAHEARIDLLQSEIQEALQQLERLGEQLPGASRRKRRALRERRRRLEAAIREAFSLLAAHRERWIAHASTPSGAPAADDEPAPDWWREVSEADWAAITLACYQAGPGRYAQLPDPPEEPKKRQPKGESFGAATVLSAWGVRIKTEPAELLGRDYGQLMMEMRAATPPSLDEME